jgi:hypothetical protein
MEAYQILFAAEVFFQLLLMVGLVFVVVLPVVCLSLTDTYLVTLKNKARCVDLPVGIEFWVDALVLLG